MENKTVKIPSGKVQLDGDLVIPKGARGIVLFAHGSGSSRLSPRNRFVAKVLQEAGIATLLFDLLTQEEEQIDDVTAELRFDISFLAKRLKDATTWIKSQVPLKIAYFGASTGSAAALIAAVGDPDIKAVVSRGGRPDLAEDALPKVKAPTLLIVGGDDMEVIELNKQAARRLKDVHIEIIKGATHLFEEPGTLEKVADLARDWFKRYL
ncbi:MAG TPA: dienelactone hydrolase family protein [Candidatus Nanoarchaeia archaeon]|nr:dienelactone hydrolase family protein [Candidatus Nanoarchaeia archaeon]